MERPLALLGGELLTRHEVPYKCSVYAAERILPEGHGYRVKRDACDGIARSVYRIQYQGLLAAVVDEPYLLTEDVERYVICSDVSQYRILGDLVDLVGGRAVSHTDLLADVRTLGYQCDGFRDLVRDLPQYPDHRRMIAFSLINDIH